MSASATMTAASTASHSPDGITLYIRLQLAAFHFDALPVGEVPPGAVGPVHPVRREVEPDDFGADDAVRHHLHLQPPPAGQRLVVESRGMSRHHRRNRNLLDLDLIKF